ncbi:MAG: Hpt domain-containing protein [Burkholderiaceae bacterium]
MQAADMEIKRGAVQTATPAHAATQAPSPHREDLSSLSWCADEIHHSLDQIEQTLGKALEGGGDLSQVSAARALLHQVHGALAMLALAGPQQLAAEAETLLDKVQAGDMVLDAEMSSALAGAFNAINEYLAELLRGMPQQPLYLYPFLRDLMALRNADRIHPADLFFPRLDVAAPESLALQPIDEDARKRVRGRFEAGLLRTLRTPQDRQSASEMLAAVEIVEHSELAATNPLFWSVLPAFFRALISGEADLDVHGKRLLARLNLQLRRTLADGSPVSERLLRDTLFSIACARPQSEALKAVFERFDLAGRVPRDVDTPRYGQVDKRAMRDVAAAVAEMKKSWETMLQSPGGVDPPG